MSSNVLQVKYFKKKNKRTRMDPFILKRAIDSNLEYIRTTFRPL